jgi:hypothetical protein
MSTKLKNNKAIKEFKIKLIEKNEKYGHNNELLDEVIILFNNHFSFYRYDV